MFIIVLPARRRRTRLAPPRARGSASGVPGSCSGYTRLRRKARAPMQANTATTYRRRSGRAAGRSADPLNRCGWSRLDADVGQRAMVMRPDSFRAMVSLSIPFLLRSEVSTWDQLRGQASSERYDAFAMMKPEADRDFELAKKRHRAYFNGVQVALARARCASAI